MKIKLTIKQRDNLILFLQRVRLVGAEVPLYLEIAEVLNRDFINKLKDKHKNYNRNQ